MSRNHNGFELNGKGYHHLKVVLWYESDYHQTPFWYRVATSSPNTILNLIILYYQQPPQGVDTKTLEAQVRLGNWSKCDRVQTYHFKKWIWV